jgi:hypothetical protein
VNSTTNYGRARQFYSKANHLEMRNARPFNMLAILAKVNNRKFEAVYYHARCLSTKNAFMSSKEGLVTIFEEMKRRWEVGEKRKGEEKESAEGEKEREREGRRIVRGSKVKLEFRMPMPMPMPMLRCDGRCGSGPGNRVAAGSTAPPARPPRPASRSSPP